MPNIAPRYYQLVFIKINDPRKFASFLQQVGPLVARYGHGLERMLAPDRVYADGMTKPDIVNLVYYDSKEAFLRFENDADFRSIVQLRKEGIEMASVTGVSPGAAAPQPGSEQRLYLVEVAQFGSEGAAGYRRYEQEAESLMRPYGYHVERVLQPDAASGFPFEPDIVKVAYFDALDGMSRFHEDPAHARLEQELYPAAVRRSAWVIARMHPSSADFASAVG